MKMSIKFVVLITLLTSVLCVTNASRILCIFHMPSTSHYILGKTYARALAEAGHDVTVISPFFEKDPPKNGSYRDIVLTGFIEDYQKKLSKINYFDKSYTNPFLLTYLTYRLGCAMTEKTLAHPNMQQLLASNETFDVVVVEQFFNDAFKGLANHFHAHQILFHSIGTNVWINPLVGNPGVHSYFPDFFTGLSGKMTFTQRVYNALVTAFIKAVMHLKFYPRQNEIMQKYIPNVPSLYDILYNSSLVLLNSDPTVYQPTPKVPSMIEIGGFHVKPTGKLPENLQKLLDEATEGVIYFSMGSTVRSKDIPLDKRKHILNAFGKLKETVLWKWEDESMTDKPPNVHIQKWIQQQDVLAHPNVKMFITHAGLLSTTEAVYHGIPILAIPIYADQFMNAKNAELNGIGLQLQTSQLTQDKLYANIQEILTNPKYKSNAMKKSKELRDKQINPLNNAVFWTEYVIRHKGAKHLRVAALELSWYQYLLLDVFGFVLLNILLLVLSVKFLFRRFR